MGRSFDVVLISHHERYSDLAKSAFVPDHGKQPPSLHDHDCQLTTVASLGREFVPIHPYTALSAQRVDRL